MTDRTAHPPLYPPGRVLALTGVVGLIGLATHAAAVGRAGPSPRSATRPGSASGSSRRWLSWRPRSGALRDSRSRRPPSVWGRDSRRTSGAAGGVGRCWAWAARRGCWAPCLWLLDWGSRPLIRRHTGPPVRSVGLFCWSRCWSCIRSPSWPRRLSSGGSCSPGCRWPRPFSAGSSGRLITSSRRRRSPGWCRWASPWGCCGGGAATFARAAPCTIWGMCSFSTYPVV